MPDALQTGKSERKDGIRLSLEVTNLKKKHNGRPNFKHKNNSIKW